MSTISVNLKGSCAALLALLGAACAPFREAPPAEPGEWLSSLGGASRSAFAGAELGDSVHVVWRKGFGRGIDVGLQVHPPLVIATTTSRTVVTINEENGMQYWSRSFSGPIAGSALRRNAVVYLATGDRDNRLHAITLARGRKIWASRRFGPFRVEPVLLEDRLVAVTETGLVVAVNEADGAELWRTPLGAPPASPPIRHGADLFVASTRDTLYRLHAADGEVADRLMLPGTPSAPPLVQGNTMTQPIFPNHVVTVDLATLTVSTPVPLSAPALASPVPVDGGVVVLTRQGDVYRVAGGAGSAQVISRLGGTVTGSLTAVGPNLVIGRLDGALFFLDQAGRVLWRQDLDDSITAPVAARGQILFVPLLRGDVVKLETW